MADKEDLRYKKFGNNYFTLTLPNGTTVLRGVLTELPPFSFSTTWNESPAAAMADEVMKLINKPEFEFLAASAPGGGAKVMRRMGNFTSKVYENAEPVSFELKFRCYPGQAFGGDKGLTSVKDWIKNLNESSISSTSDIHLKNALDTLKSAGVGAKQQVFGIIDDIKALGKSEEADTGGNNQLTETGRRKKRLNEKFSNIKQSDSATTARVTNSRGNFGAALFKLRIFPCFFNDPLVVYIPSWSVKPSKEYNLETKTNYYFDFTVTCTMDQVPSAGIWNNIMGYDDS